MLTNSVLPSGVSVMPVISQSLGPTRKRRKVAALGLDPIRVFTVILLPSALVYSTACVVPSPREPALPISIMQLVTSV